MVPHEYKTLLTFVVSICFIFCSGIANSQSILLTPREKDVQINTSFTLDVLVKDVLNLFGASFELQFDANILEVEDAVAGDLLGVDIIFFKMADKNSFSVTCSRKAGAGGVNGSGKLAAITFRAKMQDNTQITFNRNTLSLIQQDGAPIKGSDRLIIQDGKVAINLAATVKPIGKKLIAWAYVKRR